MRRTTEYTGNGRQIKLTATAELNYIRGNSAPYFSLTADGREKRGGCWRESFSGCCHDEILAQWPDLAPLAALHLSDIDGAPMYAFENGWYALAGTADYGERYHRGNSTPALDAEQCLQSFANHCRISLDEAREIADACKAAKLAVLDLPASEWRKAARAVWMERCDAMRPRWAAEAKSAIEQFGLTVTGDA